MKNIKIKVVVMGTRGKSTTTQSIAKYFMQNNLNVISKKTGTIPVINFNERSYLIDRRGRISNFGIGLENHLVLKEVLNKFPSTNALVIENNGIKRSSVSSINDYINPDIVVITTISPDHILDQGLNPELTALTFLNSVPGNCKIIFWTNHLTELQAMKKLTKNNTNIKLLFSDLKRRDNQITTEIYRASKELVKLKPPQKTDFSVKPQNFKLPKEIIAELPRDRRIINLGTVNDLLHTQLFIDEITKSKGRQLYLLINFREDRDERTWLFMEYILPKISERFNGVLIRSDHPIFTTKYIKDVCSNKYPEIIAIPVKNFEDFNNKVIEQLPEKSDVIVIANTYNDFGLSLIQEFKLFRDSYPVLDSIDLDFFK